MAQALIHNNKVIQIETSKFDTAPGLTWVQSSTAKLDDDFDPTKNGNARFSTPVAPSLPTPTIQDIKREANRRISASGHDWMVIRNISDGTIIPATIITYAADVRSASLVLEGLLPEDYQDNIHWPTVI